MQNNIQNNIQNIKGNYKSLGASLIVGLLLGWLFFGSTATINPDAAAHASHKHSTDEPTTWTCSMHPQIKQDKPGNCPICSMELIPLVKTTSKNNEAADNEIIMSDQVLKLAQIQTLKVTKGLPEHSVYLQGKVMPDERRISELTARFGGRIEKLFVNFIGQKVRKGERLATIYSPGLVTAQRELLEAISFKESRPAIYQAARGKLRLWDLTEAQIENIETKGEPRLYFDVLSPISGTVTLRHVALGDYVKEGTALLQVVDLSQLWVLFDAYESDLPWLKLNDQVSFTLQALPGTTLTGKVSYIDPFINPTTRVTKVRVEVANTASKLKPEMFANGIVESKTAESTNEVLIPKSAVLWTGKRAVVYVKVPNREMSSFLFREIVLGPEAGEFFVVKSGLQAGEEVAINGVFKIDAAAQLNGLPSMMNPPEIKKEKRK